MPITIKILLILYVSWCLFWVITREMRSYYYIFSIKDRKIRQLYLAAKFGWKWRINQLLKQEVDINYKIPIKKGSQRRTTTLLAWLLIHNRHSFWNKRTYEFLLQKGADPLVPTIKDVSHMEERLSVAQYVATLYRSFYLKKLLEIVKPTPKELNYHMETGAPPLKEAIQANAMENFKMLLDYGVEMYWDYIDSEKDDKPMNIVRSVLLSTSAIGWDFIYVWLKKGMDYSVKYADIDFPSSKTKPYLFVEIEDEGGWPSNCMDFHGGIDYVLKIIEWFEKEKGIKLKYKMKYDTDKYITKNGKKVLMTKNKKGKWVEYKKTWSYFWNVYFVYNKKRIIWTHRFLKCRVV